MNSETKIGIFVIIALIIFGFFLIKIDKIKLGQKETETYDLYAHFKNIAGLSTNATVRQQGFIIGKVKSIGLTDSQVRVIMSIRKDVELYEDSSASIKTVGLLGEKYIEINVGKKRVNKLKNQDEIKTGDAGGLDAVVDVLSSIGGDLKDVTASLKKSIGQGTGNERLEKILNNIEKFTADLKDITRENSDKIDESMTSIRNIAKDLDGKMPQISEDLKILISDLKEVVKENRANVKDSIQNIEELSDKLDKILEKIKDGEGTVGKLVTESTLHDNVNKVVKNLEDKVENATVILQQASYFQFSLGFRGEYYTEGEDLKNYITFKLRTWENMFFFAEIVDDNLARVYDPNYVEGVDSINFDRELTFTLHSAVEIGDLVLRGGLTENKFGGAVDWMFLNDAFRFTMEGWDTSRKDGPHLKVSLNYRFLDRLYLNAGYDDFINSDRAQVFLGIGFSWLY
ncbi:MAG: MCE family protein [Acidobacteria bacterium]|nr:MCE family protein [Acidobacteriota bacterium]